jgi:hypothetical protein
VGRHKDGPIKNTKYYVKKLTDLTPVICYRQITGVFLLLGEMYGQQVATRHCALDSISKSSNKADDKGLQVFRKYFFKFFFQSLAKPSFPNGIEVKGEKRRLPRFGKEVKDSWS